MVGCGVSVSSLRGRVRGGGSHRGYGSGIRLGDRIGPNPSPSPNPNPNPKQVSSRRIFFTLNGAYLGAAFTAKPLQLPLYPVAGIDSFSSVSFNFGAEPFAFDLTEAPAALHASSRRMRISRCFGSGLL